MKILKTLKYCKDFTTTKYRFISNLFYSSFIIKTRVILLVLLSFYFNFYKLCNKKYNIYLRMKR